MNVYHKKHITFLILIFFYSFHAFSQEDVKDCLDNPLFSRLTNTYISKCSNTNDVYVFPINMENSVTKMGMKTTLQYGFKSQEKLIPGFTEIVRHYETMLSKSGGKKLYINTDEGIATFYTKVPDKDIWIVINDFSKTFPGNFELNILEVEETPQVIDANEMFEDISKKGKTVLHISFDANSSDIKPSSQNIIDQLALMLKDHTSLKVNIEGHTDNSLDKKISQSLSEDRAKSVMNAVLSQGIDKTKLSSVGFGQTKPVVENNTEEGKSKNRRIEIVKITN